MQKEEEEEGFEGVGWSTECCLTSKRLAQPLLDLMGRRLADYLGHISLSKYVRPDYIQFAILTIYLALIYLHVNLQFLLRSLLFSNKYILYHEKITQKLSSFLYFINFIRFHLIELFPYSISPSLQSRTLFPPLNKIHHFFKSEYFSHSF